MKPPRTFFSGGLHPVGTSRFMAVGLYAFAAHCSCTIRLWRRWRRLDAVRPSKCDTCVHRDALSRAQSDGVGHHVFIRGFCYTNDYALRNSRAVAAPDLDAVGNDDDANRNAERCSFDRTVV